MKENERLQEQEELELMGPVFRKAIKNLMKWLDGKVEFSDEHVALLKIIAAYKALKSTQVQRQTIQWSIVRFISESPQEIKKFAEIALPEYVPLKVLSGKSEAKKG